MVGFHVCRARRIYLKQRDGCATPGTNVTLLTVLFRFSQAAHSTSCLVPSLLTVQYTSERRALVIGPNRLMKDRSRALRKGGLQPRPGTPKGRARYDSVTARILQLVRLGLDEWKLRRQLQVDHQLNAPIQLVEESRVLRGQNLAKHRKVLHSQLRDGLIHAQPLLYRAVGLVGGQRARTLHILFYQVVLRIVNLDQLPDILFIDWPEFFRFVAGQIHIGGDELLPLRAEVLPQH